MAEEPEATRVRVGFLEAWKRSWVWWTWEGRASRREYVFQWCIRTAEILAIPIAFGAFARATGQNLWPWVKGTLAGYCCAKMFPWWGVTIRRLHDAGFSGWWYWLYVIPFGGWVLAIGLLLHPGERGPNAYGIDPTLPPEKQRRLF